MDQKTLARIAGLLYLVVGVLGGFAQGYFQPLLYVAGDPAATAAQIAAHGALVPWGVVADLTQATVFLFLAFVLARVFRPAGPELTRVMVTLVAIAVALMTLNNVFEWGAYRMMTEAAFSSALGTPGQAALAYLLLDLQHSGLLIAQIFFGLWLVPLGLLGWRSGLFPRWLGGLLVAGGLGYLVNLLTLFLVPEMGQALKPWVLLPPTAAELTTVGYLLVVGVRATPKA